MPPVPQPSPKIASLPSGTPGSVGGIRLHLTAASIRGRRGRPGTAKSLVLAVLRSSTPDQAVPLTGAYVTSSIFITPDLANRRRQPIFPAAQPAVKVHT